MDEHTRQDADSSDDGASSSVLPSRRAILAAAVAVLGSGGEIPALFADTLPPKAEGFFFIHRDVKDEKNGVAAPIDRSFFLNSSWLSYFEITDNFADPIVKTKVIQIIKGGGKWDVLYSDQVLPGTAKLTSDPSAVDVPPPATTYLAMMISPP